MDLSLTNINTRPRGRRNGEQSKANISPELRIVIAEAMNSSLSSGIMLTPELLEKAIDKVTSAVSVAIDVLVDKVLVNTNAEIDTLASRFDDMDQAQRRNNIIIHGLRETPNEDVSQQVVKLVKDKLSIDIDPKDISHSHRVGQQPTKADKRADKDETINVNKRPKNHRPIVVSFARFNTKFEVYGNKKMLKGLNVVITEDLTPSRRSLYALAKEKLGKMNAWTTNGQIKVKYGSKVMNLRSQEHLARIIEDDNEVYLST